MRLSISIVLSILASLLNGCGGGGGGGGDSSSSTTTSSCTQSSPCVFSSGVTMNYLRYMYFDEATNLLYVVDGDSNLCNAGTYGRIRKFNGITGAYQSSYGGANDILCPTGVVVLNGQVFATGKIPSGRSGLINMSVLAYSRICSACPVGYGFAVSKNPLFFFF